MYARISSFDTMPYRSFLLTYVSSVASLKLLNLAMRRVVNLLVRRTRNDIIRESRVAEHPSNHAHVLLHPGNILASP